MLREPPDAPAAAAPLAKSADGLRVRYDALTGNASRVSRPGGTVTGPSRLSSERVARGFLLGRPDLYHQKPRDGAYLYVPRQYRSDGLGENVWLGQQFRGIPVFKSETQFHVSVRGEILSVSGSPVPDLPATITAVAPRISASEALARAAAFGDMTLRRGPAALHAPQGVRRAVTFDRGDDFSERPVVQLTYFPTARGRTSLAWDTTLWQARSTDVYHILVDASSGRLLYRKNYTSYASGQVYDQDSPQDGTPYVGVPPVLARVVKPFGGGDLFDGSPLFAPGDPHTDWWAGASATTTVSNNTRAGSARAGVLNAITPASAPASDFSFSLDLSQDPAAYQSAAITNLFYWNNRVHDVWYQFGFNEAAGNFQTTNFGLGGAENDAVVAHAQYGADVPGSQFRDNANMATPPDGSPGRMRMYVFDITNPFRDGDLDNEVIVHEYGHGVTNRLVGNGNGLVGFQGEAMGEGWSDFQELMILAQSTDDVNGRYPTGGYVLNEFAGGIRSQPYSAIPGVFTHTYAQISGYNGGQPEVHDAGEIMCNALFQTYVRLVNRLGFSPGRRRIMQLFIDALKLSPDDPTFLDFRDALLQADQVRYGGADLGDIWACFASRGMGVSASTSGPSDTAPREAFDFPVTFTISGTVTENGVGKNGVSVSAGGHTVVTDGTGSYAITNLSAGSYTVTATISGYTCATQTPTVTVGPNARVDFIATRLTYSISGTVRDGTNPLSGATVSAGGKTVTTVANGTYLIDGLVDGTYTVTVSKSGVTFSVSSQPVTVGPNATAVDFTGSSLPVVVNFTLAANPVRGKKTVKGTFTLSKAVAANTKVSISSSSAVAKVAKAAVVVKKGASSGAFSIKTAKVTAPAVVTLSFTLNGTTYSRQVTVQP